MIDRTFADPNDILWSDDLVNIVNKDVRRLLRVPQNEPSPHDARLAGAHHRSFPEGEPSRLGSYVKLEYEVTLPVSKEEKFDTIMTGELGYDRVRFKTTAPEDVTRWEDKAVYRHGPPERFVQIDAYFVSDDAFEQMHGSDRTA